MFRCDSEYLDWTELARHSLAPVPWDAAAQRGDSAGGGAAVCAAAGASRRSRIQRPSRPACPSARPRQAPRTAVGASAGGSARGFARGCERKYYWAECCEDQLHERHSRRRPHTHARADAARRVALCSSRPRDHSVGVLGSSGRVAARVTRDTARSQDGEARGTLPWQRRHSLRTSDGASRGTSV